MPREFSANDTRNRVMSTDTRIVDDPRALVAATGAQKLDGDLERYWRDQGRPFIKLKDVEPSNVGISTPVDVWRLYSASRVGPLSMRVIAIATGAVIVTQAATSQCSSFEVAG